MHLFSTILLVFNHYAETEFIYLLYLATIAKILCHFPKTAHLWAPRDIVGYLVDILVRPFSLAIIGNSPWRT